MEKQYEFDVALSFAIENLEIATEIAKELDRLEISNYLFSEEDLWGVNIKKETWEVYHEKAMFALLLISKNYLEKRWATEEREIVQTVTRENNQPYVLPLRLDYHGTVEGLSNNISYRVWEGNAASIAITISRLVTKYKKINKEVAKNKFQDKNQLTTDYIKGDKVKGDKVKGDKVKGDKISVVTGDVKDSKIIGVKHINKKN